MARVILRPAARIPSQGGTGEVPVLVDYAVATNSTDPQRVMEFLKYVDAADRFGMWHFEVPDAYNDSGNVTVRIHSYANATSGDAIMIARFIDTADDAALLSDDWGTSNSITVSAKATANDLIITTSAITRANADTITAGNYATFLLGRDGDNGSDTLTTDLNVIMVVLDFAES